MKRSRTVQVEHYRGCQIETRDARDGGWVVCISSWEGLQPAGTVLRSDSPLALAGLLSEAHDRIDAALVQGDSGGRVEDSNLGQRLNPAYPIINNN